MSNFKYSESEKNLNKILKYNQKRSKDILDDETILESRVQADSVIKSAEEILQSLGYNKNIFESKQKINNENKKLDNKPKLEEWDDLIIAANENFPDEIILEDLLTKEEINNVYKELDAINIEFSKKTTLINKVDLNFLAIATALQVTKSLLFPYISKKFEYGEKFDTSQRLNHDDKSIKNAQKKANDNFKDKYSDKYSEGYWMKMLYQPPPYDITIGSKDLGINMGGAYHRLYTLGHDPILGWLFGTANILTDVITLNNFQSYRVSRTPMRITPQNISVFTMFHESYQISRQNVLNLPAAVFTQAQHLKSDVFTKLGLPVPLLSVLNENFASKLYKNQYDSLCFTRDIKIVGISYVTSLIIDIIIGLIHGLFRKKDESKDLFEVRTRKILLISNSIASSSSIIASSFTKNIQTLDIGSLLSTVTHLFSDIRFILKIKQEFVQNEIDKTLKIEFDKIDRLYDEL